MREAYLLKCEKCGCVDRFEASEIIELNLLVHCPECGAPMSLSFKIKPNSKKHRRAEEVVTNGCEFLGKVF